MHIFYILYYTINDNLTALFFFIMSAIKWFKEKGIGFEIGIELYDGQIPIDGRQFLKVWVRRNTRSKKFCHLFYRSIGMNRMKEGELTGMWVPTNGEVISRDTDGSAYFRIQKQPYLRRKGSRKKIDAPFNFYGDCPKDGMVTSDRTNNMSLTFVGMLLGYTNKFWPADGSISIETARDNLREYLRSDKAFRTNVMAWPNSWVNSVDKFLHVFLNKEHSQLWKYYLAQGPVIRKFIEHVQSKGLAVQPLDINNYGATCYPPPLPRKLRTKGKDKDYIDPYEKNVVPGLYRSIESTPSYPSIRQRGRRGRMVWTEPYDATDSIHRPTTRYPPGTPRVSLYMPGMGEPVEFVDEGSVNTTTTEGGGCCIS